MTEAPPPADLDAEGAVLASLAAAPESVERVLATLAPSHFFSKANGLLYEAVLSLREAGAGIDEMTLAAWLRDRGRLGDVGGPEYVYRVLNHIPPRARVEDYAGIVVAKWRLRQLIALCQEYGAEARGAVEDVQTLIERAEVSLGDLARDQGSSALLLAGEVAFHEYMRLKTAHDAQQPLTGTPTGFAALDARLAGLHEGDSIILAGRPGMGKSAFAGAIALNVARSGAGVAFFSIEMPAATVCMRLACALSGVNATRVRTGTLRAEEWHPLGVGVEDLRTLPIWIDDTPGTTVSHIRGKTRQLAAQIARGASGISCSRLGLIVIDYVQLVQAPHVAGRNREQEVAEISKAIKRTAKELSCPVLALSALSRKVEDRGKDKRPELSDLRESGSLESDADVVLFLYREDYYQRNDPSLRGFAEIIVGKNRNGPTGTAKVAFQPASMRFANLAEGEYDVGGYDQGAEEL